MKVLVVLPRFPLPTDKGDKLRAWHQVQGLAEQNEVYLYCTSDEPVQEEHLQRVKQICREVEVFPLSKIAVLWRLATNVFRNTPFQVAYFQSLASVKRLRQMALRIQPDVVYCQLARMAEHVIPLPQTRKVLDYQDAFSKGLERRLEHEAWWKRPLVKLEYQRLRTYEREIFDAFDERLIISAQDAALIDHPKHQEIRILPNGVDLDYYRPEPSAKTIDLLFTGNLQYEPNVNCIQYLVREVLPLLRDEFPHLQLVAAGKDPSRELQRLHARNLQLTGWVPDLRKYYRQSRLFVAPMQIGVGMQNKILEAMASGMPVITSSLTNNAIGGTHGHDIWIADTPSKVAEGISYLLNNTELALRLGQNARELMQKQYSWAEQNRQLQRYLSQESDHPAYSSSIQ